MTMYLKSFAPWLAYALAADALARGQSAIVDAVHGWPGAEALWTRTLSGSDAALVRVALTCGDAKLHQTRLETRAVSAGDPQPRWSGLSRRGYRPLETAEVKLDTATLSPDAAVDAIREAMSAAGWR